MNIINLVGRVANDLEKKEIGNNNNTVCNFAVAVRRNADEVDFVDCTAWNKTAELICNYCKKGEQLAVSGTLRTQTYQNAEGVNVKKSFVLVNNITLIAGQKKETQPSAPPAPPAEFNPNFDEDDYPF